MTNQIVALFRMSLHIVTSLWVTFDERRKRKKVEASEPVTVVTSGQRTASAPHGNIDNNFGRC